MLVESKQRKDIETVAQATRTLHGKLQISGSKHEVVLVCVVRDAEKFVPSFMEHYLGLGVERFVFLDNDSCDRTADIITDYNTNTLLQCPLPFADYSRTFRQFLVDRCSHSGWCLHIDIDEHLYYPGSDEKHLPDLIETLNEQDAEVVLATQLDMFSDNPLAEIDLPETNPLQSFPFYDISEMIECPPPTEPLLRDPRLSYCLNGIRSRVFDREFYLFKYPLVRLTPQFSVEQIQIHEMEGSPRAANISGALLHYKLHNHLLSQSKKAVERKNYWKESIEYKAYLRALQENPNLNVFELAPSPQRLCDISQLNSLKFVRT